MKQLFKYCVPFALVALVACSRNDTPTGEPDPGSIEVETALTPPEAKLVDLCGAPGADPEKQPEMFMNLQAFIPKEIDFPPISVYFHVVKGAVRSDAGDEAQARNDDTLAIVKQLEVLNDAYSGRTASACSLTSGPPLDAGISFRMGGIPDFHVKQEWSSFNLEPPDPESLDAMKADTAKGRAQTQFDLHVWIVERTPFTPALGTSTPPWHPFDLTTDGLVISREVLPGDSSTTNNSGDILVHETGHWLGLYHTFERNGYADGCRGPGDYIADTSAHARGSGLAIHAAQHMKPAGCKDTTGAPYDNYMDYAPDSCLVRFTAGQITAMQHIAYVRSRNQLRVIIKPAP